MFQGCHLEQSLTKNHFELGHLGSDSITQLTHMELADGCHWLVHWVAKLVSRVRCPTGSSSMMHNCTLLMQKLEQKKIERKLFLCNKQTIKITSIEAKRWLNLIRSNKL